ncbi:MAG: hypothetical protein ACR2IL_11935 [Chitinophagaceae bacterium]
MACLCLGASASMAQSNNNAPAKKMKKNYTSVGVEGSMLQWARLNSSDRVIPRYSYFFNMGVDYNRRLDKTVSVFTGLHLKNIGLIRQERIEAGQSGILPVNIRTKERVYTLGAPIGLRVSSRDGKSEFKVGMDCAVALNYKAKVFWNDTKMDKFNEWFSPEAATLHYSVFAGFNLYGVSVTSNYYLNNFFGRNSPLKANMVTVGLGIQLDDSDVKKKRKL